MVSVLEPPKPRLRGRIHQVAFFVALPASVVLIALAAGTTARTVATIYAVSLVAVFGSSAAYHRGTWTERGRRWMKRLDHSMIFVLIAGTYTPVAVFALEGAWEAVLLSTVWAGAALGVALKIARPDGLRIVTATLYMALGWLAIVALPQMLRAMSVAEVVLMLTGGLIYTAGAIVFATRRPDPRPDVFGYHEVWHVFMVVAAACHFVLVALVVVAP